MNNRLQLFLALALVSLQLQAQSGGALPPNPEAGKCYAKCLIPTAFDTNLDSVLVDPGKTVTMVAEPEYETIRERVVIKPPSVELVAVEPVFQTVEEKIEIRPESKRYIYEPAEYETVTERFIIRDSSTRIAIEEGRFEEVANSQVYQGNDYGQSVPVADLLDPNNPNHPNQPKSIFNPANPNSPFNPNNPNSIYHPSSPYNPDNPDNVLDASNPQSPFNPDNAGNTDSRAVAQALELAATGSILPYIIKEASVKIDRLPMEYDVLNDSVQVRPAAYQWVRQPIAGCTAPEPGACMVWCFVEKPAEYEIVTRRDEKGCAEGYVAVTSPDSDEAFCARLLYTPAEFGVRTIMAKGPVLEEESIPPRYIQVERQKMIKPASVREEIIPAEYRTIEKEVLVSEGRVDRKYVPAKYKTVTRRVRKGLGQVAYFDPSRTLLLPETPDGDNPPAPYPTVVNPGTGAPLPGIAMSGPPATGSNVKSINTGLSEIPEGLPEDYYSAGCPEGFRFDPIDGVCKKLVEVPAVYDMVARQSPARQASFSEWREIVCPAKMTPALIRQIQEALAEKGYKPGPIDGVMGARTKSALAKFQQDNQLPMGNTNLETLRALGLR